MNSFVRNKKNKNYRKLLINPSVFHNFLSSLSPWIIFLYSSLFPSFDSFHSRATFGIPVATGCLHFWCILMAKWVCSLLFQPSQEDKTYPSTVFLIFYVQWRCPLIFMALPPNRFLKIAPGGFVVCSTLNHRHSRDYTAIWRHRPMCDSNHVSLFISVLWSNCIARFVGLGWVLPYNTKVERPTKIHFEILRFSQPSFVVKLILLDTTPCVVGRVFPEISKLKALRSSEISENNCPMTICQVPENVTF